MKRNISDNLKAVVFAVPLIVITGEVSFLPWWFFVVPLGGLGLVFTLRNRDIASFPVGFLSGFIVWFSGNIYFDATLGGHTLNKIALLVSLPELVVLIASGFTGGLLAGLALYLGKQLIFLRTQGRSSYDKE